MSGFADIHAGCPGDTLPEAFFVALRNWLEFLAGVMEAGLQAFLSGVGG
jgi:hypothetical protein